MDTATSSSSDRSRPLIFAHRGARAELPENTIEAFSRALERRAGALETDVRLTADGHLVIFHDADGERIAHRSREVETTTLAELRTWDVGYAFEKDGSHPFVGQGYRAPLLSEALEAFPEARFNVDLKPRSRASADVAMKVIREAKAEARVLLACADSRVLDYVRDHGYRGATGFGATEVVRLLMTPLSMLSPRSFRGAAVQIPHKAGPIDLGTQATLARCRAIGARLHVFTVNDVARARELAEQGVDGIMTDDPAKIVAAW
ncbi:MAG: glycerophosphodiester phosphodiesterase family protein [Polyangiaceae bacterium]